MARTLQTLLLVLLAGASPLIHAVEPGAGPSACAGIDEAAARLACYDRAVGRETLAERTIAATRPADVFSNETLGDVNRCDKGAPSSLLDARWELDADTAEDPKPATFCIRPFRPIYLMPFYTSRTNQTPSSPTPENNVSGPQGINRRRRGRIAGDDNDLGLPGDQKPGDLGGKLNDLLDRPSAIGDMGLVSKVEQVLVG